MKRSLLALAIASAFGLALRAAPGTVQRPITVGEFAVRVARAIGSPAHDRSGAASSLRHLGIDLGNDLDASLTEGGASRILGDLGLKVVTAHPDGTVSVDKADQLAIAASAASIASTVPAAALPTQCLTLGNRGQCDTCCTNYLASLGLPTDKPVCAKFCSSVLPPGQVSSSQPPP